jgi:hypothetical protein
MKANKNNFTVKNNIIDRNKSSMYNKNALGPLAQLVEQLTLNQWVRGSSPRWVTYFFDRDFIKKIRKIKEKQLTKVARRATLYFAPSSRFNQYIPLI